MVAVSFFFLSYRLHLNHLEDEEEGGAGGGGGISFFFCVSRLAKLYLAAGKTQLYISLLDGAAALLIVIHNRYLAPDERLS